MNEEKEMQPEQVQAPLSEKKRTAMLRYIAVLFAVAFALVLLSHLIQSRSSETTIRELNATSVIALQNAEKLQEDNRSLTEKNEELSEALDNANSVVAEYHESMSAELAGAYQRGVDETAKAYELLMKAMAEQDEELRAKLLAELEPLKGCLTEDAQKTLEELKIKP